MSGAHLHFERAELDAHARTLDAAGLREARVNACGYSLGATYAPNWMDWPMLFHGNAVEVEPGTVFFLHLIAFDGVRGLAMTLGRTSVVGSGGWRFCRGSRLNW